MVQKEKTVFIAITHGWHARLLLQTKFLETLAEQKDLKVVLFSPNGNEENFINKYGHLAKIEATEPQGGKYWDRFNRIRKYLITGKMSETKKIQLEKYKQKTPLYYLVVQTINFFLKNIPITKKCYQLLEKLIFRDKYFKHYFYQYKPDAVIIVSTVHNEAFYMLQRAQIENVKVIQIVESWDNPSSKLNQVNHPDDFLVWNKVMCDELNEFLGIAKNRISITGTAFHDIYAHRDTFKPKEEISKQYNMNPEKKWIVIAATLTPLYPEFDLFIEDLDRMKKEGHFSEDFQILIRPHPQAISGYSLGHGISELNAIQQKYDYIFYDIPPVIESTLPVYLQKRDIKNFAEILYYSDLVISFFSTATIDASASGTPVILPAFKHGMKNFIFPTLSERIKFTHHYKLIETKGVEVVHNMEELANQVNIYLNGDDNSYEGRKRLVKLECGVIDGLSYKRMVNAINNILFKNTNEPDLNQDPKYYY